MLYTDGVHDLDGLCFSPTRTRVLGRPQDLVSVCCSRCTCANIHTLSSVNTCVPYALALRVYIAPQELLLLSKPTERYIVHCLIIYYVCCINSDIVRLSEPEKQHYIHIPSAITYAGKGFFFFNVHYDSFCRLVSLDRITLTKT